MDLIKKLTGKNPSEYESVAQSLVNNSDVELFKNLVEQDDFLFDFIKNNVAKRIQQACNNDNYLNLFNFLDYYSPSYADMIVEVIHRFGREAVFEKFKDLLLNGNNAQKAYSIKYLSLSDNDKIKEFLPSIREFAKSDYEPLSINSTELLGKLDDEASKQEALEKLNSSDEFEQYEGVKFLVTYGAKDTLNKIIEAMKKSGLCENIACEIPYLIPLQDLIESDYESAMLVLCNIISAIPDIIPISSVCDFYLADFLEAVISKLPESSAAIVLRIAKEKFEELSSNEEYLFDSDKNTKEEVKNIHQMLSKLKTGRLNSLIYDELYAESNFVLFAIDYANEPEELETLLDCGNSTITLKVLGRLKELNQLKPEHKNIALANIKLPEIKEIVNAI